MIVEFVGPTASGKSTLTGLLQARLRAEGVDAPTADEVALGPLVGVLGRHRVLRAIAVQTLSLPWLVVGLVRWRGLVPVLARGIVLHGERVGFRLHCVRNALLHVALEARARSVSRGRVVLLDEGLLSFVDLFAETRRRPDSDEIGAYARIVPVPDVVVHVATSVDVRVGRILGRGHRRLRAADRRAVDGYARNGDEAAHLMASTPHVARHLVVVDPGASATSVQAAVEAVYAEVTRALRSEEAAGARARP